MRFKFISLKTNNGLRSGKIAFYCGALNVSRQGIYEHLKNLEKPYKYAVLAAEMHKIIEEDFCNDCYGFTRMHEALSFKKSEFDGFFPHIPSERTVYRIMEHESLIHKPKRKPNGITKSDRDAQKSDNLLNRDFSAEKPCEKCVTDITEIKCRDKKIYVSAILDCFSNEVLALKIYVNMRAELVCDTVKEAVKMYPDMLKNHAIIHSDRGSQYTSELFRTSIAKFGLRQSMNSAAGRCHDNAKCESLWAQLKEELLYGRYHTEKMLAEDVEWLVWQYFMSYWNNRRICSAIGGIPPAEKRKRYGVQNKESA